MKDIYTERRIMDDVYHTSSNDNEVAYSIEDRRFIHIVEHGIHKNELGNWKLPLPFRSSGVRLPDNREHAIKRLNNLRRTFVRRPKMKRDYFQFMEKLLKRGHAIQLTKAKKVQQQDRVGPEKRNVWYLPQLGVYHPNKPDNIPVVFPLGILIRFRQETVGVACDIEQMFHCFYVDPKDRDVLRFFWFKDNNPNEEIVEYHMTVHLFGNMYFESSHCDLWLMKDGS